MSQVKLEGNVREKTGKGVARKLRRAGRLPGVLYGHHMENPIALDLDGKEMDHILHAAGRTALINLTLKGNGGGTHTAMIVDWQRDVLGTRLTHVDLKQVALDEKVRAMVPVVLVGNSIGVKAGGVMEQILREVEVEALPLSIPEHLEVDVTDLDVGGHLNISEAVLPEGATLITGVDETVAVVHSTRTGAATTEEGGELLPEAEETAAE